MCFLDDSLKRRNIICEFCAVSKEILKHYRDDSALGQMVITSQVKNGYLIRINDPLWIVFRVGHLGESEARKAAPQTLVVCLHRFERRVNIRQVSDYNMHAGVAD